MKVITAVCPDFKELLSEDTIIVGVIVSNCIVFMLDGELLLKYRFVNLPPAILILPSAIILLEGENIA